LVNAPAMNWGGFLVGAGRKSAPQNARKPAAVKDKLGPEFPGFWRACRRQAPIADNQKHFFSLF